MLDGVQVPEHPEEVGGCGGSVDEEQPRGGSGRLHHQDQVKNSRRTEVEQTKNDVEQSCENGTIVKLAKNRRNKPAYQDFFLNEG